MNLKDFGMFLKNYRDKRDNKFVRWRQEDLAERSGISVRTISRIEQGKAEKILGFLPSIARAFNFNEIQKGEFYARAGYYYRPQLRQESRIAVERILSDFTLPASAKNPVWDFIGFNEYHRLLWGYSHENIALLDSDDDIGANLLRVFFDERFYSSQSQEPEVKEALHRAVMIFRTDAFPYSMTERYQQLIAAMMVTYPKFEQVWNDLEHMRAETSNSMLFSDPHSMLTHPTYGLIAKIGLVLPRRYTGYGIDFSVHVPVETPETAEGYSKLLAEFAATKSQVYMFRKRSLK